MLLFFVVNRHPSGRVMAKYNLLLAFLVLVDSALATLEDLSPAGLGDMASLALGGNPLENLLSEGGLKSELETLSKLAEKVEENPLAKKLTKGPSMESFKGPQMPMMKPMPGAGKLAKVAIKKPLKKVALKKAVAAKVLIPKVKAPMIALKAKPKVHSLEPIVHVIEKPVAVYHKVPVPKKVLVPKFYKVYKPIPVPKIIPVPFKVPVKKIIPKIVKIPKPIPVPKFIPVKKPIPIGIPYPVPKIYKVPVWKPVPYKKYIPIPIPKKVPKFIPVPVKKIIKVPKPYYVPIKVPHITTSYIKTPMTVKVPDVKKVKFLKGKDFPGTNKFKAEKSSEPKFPFEEEMKNIVMPHGDMNLESYKLKETVKDLVGEL